MIEPMEDERIGLLSLKEKVFFFLFSYPQMITNQQQIILICKGPQLAKQTFQKNLIYLSNTIKKINNFQVYQIYIIKTFKENHFISSLNRERESILMKMVFQEVFLHQEQNLLKIKIKKKALIINLNKLSLQEELPQKVSQDQL